MKSTAFWFLVATVLVSFQSLTAIAATSAKATDEDAFPSTDEHTAAALKRAHAKPASDAPKKIVKAPTPVATATPEPGAAADEVPASTLTDSDGSDYPPKKPVVESEPAPGTAPTGDNSSVIVEKEEDAKSLPAADDNSEAVAPEVKADTKTEPVMKLKPAKQVTAAKTNHAPSAATSLKWLENGNTRYVKKHFRADGRKQADRDRTKSAQQPHAIVLSCSDSRVPPEMVFDQGIGELSVVRTAGETLDSAVIASLEHAVEAYGVHLLVVMGHTNCDAVDAALNIKDGESAGSMALDQLLADIKVHLKTRTSEARSKNLEIESILNADGFARDLLKRSDLLRSKVEAGELTIKPALYWIDSGKVKFY